MPYKNIKYNPNYYQTKKWLYLRSLMLKWYPQCQKCGNKNILQVHHKNYKSFGDEMPWDLIVLCEECHKDIHYIGKPDSEIVMR